MTKKLGSADFYAGFCMQVIKDIGKEGRRYARETIAWLRQHDPDLAEATRIKLNHLSKQNG